MTLLWYRLRALWLAAFAATACFAMVAAAGILVEEVGRLAASQGGLALASSWFVLTALQCVPHVVSTSLPVSCAFVAVQWARRGELLAAAQLGESPRRLQATVALAYLVPAAACWALAAFVQPDVALARNRLASHSLHGGDALSRAWVEPPSWFRWPGSILFLPAQPPAGASERDCEGHASCFVSPALYDWQGGRILRVTSARALIYEQGAWWLLRGRRDDLDAPAVQAFARQALPHAALPDSLSSLVGNPKELRSPALAALIARRRAAGLPVEVHVWEQASRWAQAAALLAMVVAVAPLLLGVERRRTLTRAVALTAAATLANAVLAQAAHMGYVAVGWPAPVAAALPALAWLCAALTPSFRAARLWQTPRR